MRNIKQKDAIVRAMESAGMEVDREGYIAMATDNGDFPWTAEQEANLPEELRDWEAYRRDQEEAQAEQATDNEE